MVIVTEALMERHPDATEGDLAWMRQDVVDQAHCAAVARDAGLPARMAAQAPPGANTAVGEMPRVQAALAEAVIGAGWLELPRADVTAAVRGAFGHALAAARPGHRDPKTALQEHVQRTGAAVTYTLVGTRGPAHARVFRARADVDGSPLAEGEGPSKRAAEREAARGALAALGAGGDPPPASTS
ncbi:MAG: ribonuclease III [Thermoleophilia bacterium]|nr:ribonuclease III [Thermoleophilia bacterium]